MPISKNIRAVGGTLLFSIMLIAGRAQPVNTQAPEIANFPAHLLSNIRSKITNLNTQLTKQTESYLRRMARQEGWLQKKLSAIDAPAAQTLFSGATERYAALARQLLTDSGSQSRSFSGAYLPYLDSLQGCIAFLGQRTADLTPKAAARWQSVNVQLRILQAKLQHAEQVKTFIQQRKQQISGYISEHADLQNLLEKPAAKINKEVYYYSQQLRQYKEMWDNPDRVEQRALTLLSRTAAFQDFMKDHSMLGKLFDMPRSYGTSRALAGLQTKAQVAQLVQSKVGDLNAAAGGADNAEANAGLAALQSDLQNAQSKLDAYKCKVSTLGNGNGDLNMPDFKPNDQHTKTFLKRLEYGTNFQTTRTDYYFPTVADLGLSLGYKLGHNNVIGVGASYKLGWGNGIQHISFSSQGVGIRSFLQIRIEKSFSATGGFECNYMTPFPAFSQLPRLENWTSSGLIGATKTISVKNRVFKRTNLSLLWDFLSYQQVPRTQPLLFRVGYSLN
jgi:hypothetical protein